MNPLVQCTRKTLGPPDRGTVSGLFDWGALTSCLPGADFRRAVSWASTPVVAGLLQSAAGRAGLSEDARGCTGHARARRFASVEVL